MTPDEEVVSALADPEYRKIIFSVINTAKTTKQIIAETGIPGSTAFKIMRRLQSLDLIRIEKLHVETDRKNGPPAALYSSVILSANIEIKAMVPKVTLVKK